MSREQRLRERIGALHKALADIPFADRRHRRHRKCELHLCRGETSKELRLARRRRSSAEPAQRCRLCRQRDRAPGPSATSTRRRLRTLHADRQPSGTRHAEDSVSSCEKPGPDASSRRSGPAAHRFLADEPVEAGGLDSGPGPYDLVLAGLGACTSMTLRLYAERKALPLDRVTVRLRHCQDPRRRLRKLRDQGRDARSHRSRHHARGRRSTHEQRKRLLEIADKCPVHRTLTSEIDIRTVEES